MPIMVSPWIVAARELAVGLVGGEVHVLEYRGGFVRSQTKTDKLLLLMLVSAGA